MRNWEAKKGLMALVVQFVPNAQRPVGVQLAAPGVKEEPQPAGKAGAVTHQSLHPGIRSHIDRGWPSVLVAAAWGLGSDWVLVSRRCMYPGQEPEWRPRWAARLKETDRRVRSLRRTVRIETKIVEVPQRNAFAF